MIRSILVSLTAGLFVLPVIPATAQVKSLNPARTAGQAADEIAPETLQLTVAPAAEPVPALKYTLTPRNRELQPGDATPFFYRALLMQAEIPAATRQKFSDRSESWFGQQVDQTVRDEMRQWLVAHESSLAELRKATYCERAEVDLRLRDLRGIAAVSFLLPDAQNSRNLARVLKVQARLAIREGRYDDALESIRMGIRLAGLVAVPPTLINDLVGISIVSLMSDELLQLSAAPNSPNLYWAIASLPQPVIDMRAAFEQEGSFPEQVFPFLRDAETADRTPDQWRQLMLMTFEQIHQLSTEWPGKPAPFNELTTSWHMLRAYPSAKQTLLELGFDSNRIEAMPVGQALAVATARTHRRTYEDLFKWTSLPYSAGASRLRQAEQKAFGNTPNESELRIEAIPISRLLLPAISQAWHASIRESRKLGSLQVIEAIRMHAASGGDKLPASLSDIRIVPVPLDPLLNQPFKYRVDGANATLEYEAPDYRPGRYEGRRYVIGLRSSESASGGHQAAGGKR